MGKENYPTKKELDYLSRLKKDASRRLDYEFSPEARALFATRMGFIQSQEGFSLEILAEARDFQLSNQN